MAVTPLNLVGLGGLGLPELLPDPGLTLDPEQLPPPQAPGPAPTSPPSPQAPGPAPPAEGAPQSPQEGPPTTLDDLRQRLVGRVRGAPAAQQPAPPGADVEASLRSPFTSQAPGSEAAVQDLEGRSLGLLQRAGEIETEADRLAAEAEADAISRKQVAAARHDIQATRLAEEKTRRIEALVEERNQLAREIGESKIIEREPSILNLIGVFLAGFLNPTGRNMAAELVQRRIERDLKRQRAELENKKFLLTTKDNELSTLFKIYGDKEAALAAARERAYEKVSLEFQKRLAQIKDPRIQAAGLKTAAALQDRARQAHLDLMERATKRAEREEDMRMERRRLALDARRVRATEEHYRRQDAIEAARLALERESAQAQRDAARAEEGPNVVGNKLYGVKVTTDDGRTLDHIVVENKERLKHLDEVVSAGRKKHRTLQNILELGAGRDVIRGEHKALVQALWNKLQLEEQLAVKGAPSNVDVELIRKSLGMNDPSSAFDLLGSDEREHIIRIMQDLNAQEVTEELQQVTGKSVVWVPPKGSLLEKPVPAEEKDPVRQIREIGAGALSPEVRREQVTTERYTIESDIGVRAVQATSQAINELRDSALSNAERLKRIDALRAELLQAREEVERRFDERLQPFRGSGPGGPSQPPQPREPTAEEREQRRAALHGITAALMNLEEYRKQVLISKMQNPFR